MQANKGIHRNAYLAYAKGALNAHKHIPWWQPVNKFKCYITALASFGHLQKEIDNLSNKS